MGAWYEATGDGVLDTFETAGQVTLRIDADTLVFASPVELSVGRGHPPGVRLRVGVLPSQMLRLRERLGLSASDLAAWRPRVPVTLFWRGDSRLVESFERAQAEGRDLESCVVSKGPSGFPAFFDLANYVFERAAQP